MPETVLVGIALKGNAPTKVANIQWIFTDALRFEAIPTT